MLIMYFNDIIRYVIAKFGLILNRVKKESGIMHRVSVSDKI